VHAGGAGLGFHGLYNLEAGITQFGHFKDKATGTDLASGSSNDFTFGFGGGLGYGFAPNMDMYVGEQWDIILHSQGDATETEAPRQLTFRIGFRVGF
jgi:opacity protein-like surface antigen